MSQSWWDAKMRGTTPQQPAAPLPPTPVAIPQPMNNNYPPQYPAQQPVAPTRAPSGCPECGSGNWMQPNSSTAARCFDCGHVDGRDFDLSANGSISNNAPSRATKQVASGGFNPQQIVGRIE